jgi:hypothetical protein
LDMICPRSVAEVCGAAERVPHTNGHKALGLT